MQLIIILYWGLVERILTRYCESSEIYKINKGTISKNVYRHVSYEIAHRTHKWGLIGSFRFTKTCDRKNSYGCS